MPVLTLASSGPLARALTRFAQNRAAMIGLALLVPMLALILSYPWWLPYRPNDIDLLAMNAGPSAKHWFGTDGVGRDVFARTLEGGRISLLVAGSSVVISTAIGFLVGAIAAFSGRWGDAIAMRSVDLAMTLPPVIFLLVLASIGSSAPYIGLLGTVWGVYHALLSIGLSGQGTLDKVAGPVGEALIMTALGLAVAIPAVLGYNGLVRANRVTMGRITSLASRLIRTITTGEPPASAGAPRHAAGATHPAASGAH